MHRELCALKGLLRAVSSLEESIRDAYGVTLTEALCLCSIGAGCTGAGPLGEELTLSASRLSRILTALERKGLVQRNRRSEDRRSWDVEATTEGKALLDRMRAGQIELPEELRVLAGV